MNDTVKCAVYYDSTGLPSLCHDFHCMSCEHDCFDAVVKIIPIEIDDIDQELLGNLSEGLDKTNRSVGRFSKEMKKTIDSLSRLRKKFK